MARALLVFLLFYFWPHGQVASSLPPEFILWNVGQGQWVTISDWRSCTHIDMGGDWWPKQSLKKLCSQKDNQVYFTHGDWDHIGFLKSFVRAVGPLCLAGKMSDPKNQAWVRQLPRCKKSFNNDVEALTFQRQNVDRLKANDHSDIYLFQSVFLIPGDSPRRQEKTWTNLGAMKQVHTLVLGHHGSQTSTSNFMLQKLPQLKQAMASARKAKYGHPHRKVLTRLRRYRVPTLSTEDWGHLRFLLAE